MVSFALARGGGEFDLCRERAEPSSRVFPEIMESRILAIHRCAARGGHGKSRVVDVQVLITLAV